MAELQVPVLCAGCPNLILCEKSLVIFKIENLYMRTIEVEQNI